MVEELQMDTVLVSHFGPSPPIVLALAPIYLGRSAETGITDTHVSRKQGLISLSDGEQENIHVKLTTTGQNPCYVKQPSDKGWVVVPLGKSLVLPVGSCVSLDEPQKGYIFTISSQPTTVKMHEPDITASHQTAVKKKQQQPLSSSTPVSVLRQWESDDLQLDTPALYKQFGGGLILPPGSCQALKNAEASCSLVPALSGEMRTERNNLLFSDSSSSPAMDWRGKRSVVPVASEEKKKESGESNSDNEKGADGSEDGEEKKVVVAEKVVVEKEEEEEGEEGDEEQESKGQSKRKRAHSMVRELEDCFGGGSRCPLRSSSKRIRRASCSGGVRSSSVAGRASRSRNQASGRGCRRM
jgi:hypothetical protein